MGDLPGLIPATDLAQRRVTGHCVQQRSGGGESVDGLGYEGAGDSQPVFGGAANPSRPQGTKRASGTISKTATRRLAGPVNSPNSSCKVGKRLD